MWHAPWLMRHAWPSFVCSGMAPRDEKMYTMQFFFVHPPVRYTRADVYGAPAVGMSAEAAAAQTSAYHVQQ